MIAKHFPPADAAAAGQDFFRGEDIGDLRERELSSVDVKERGSLKYVIHTRVGGGPRVLEEEEQRLLDTSGKPKDTTAGDQ